MDSRSPNVLYAAVLNTRRFITIENCCIAVILLMTLLQISRSPYVKPLVPSVRTGYEFVFINGIILLIAAWIAVRSNPFVGLFLASAIISAHYPSSNPLSRETLTYITLGCLLYHILVQHMTNEDAWLDLICAIVLINCIFLSLQAADLDFTDRHPRFEPIISGFSGDVPVGLLSCPNEAAAMLAIGSAAFLRGRLKWGLIPIAFGFWQAHTFAGPMSAVAGLSAITLVYFPFPLRVKLFVIFLLCGVLLFYAIFIDVPDVNWRWKSWKFAITQLYPQRPLLGWGLGGWAQFFTIKEVARAFDYKAMYQAHNDILQYIFQMGVLFIIALTGFALRLFRSWRMLGPIIIFALFAILANQSVFFTFHNPIIAGVCIIWLSLAEARRRRQLSSCFS